MKLPPPSPDTGLLPRILVVDDDPSIRTGIRITLESAGLEVAESSDAEEARIWMERNGLPDLALFDIRLPGDSGIDLAREIGRTCDLPIVMISAVGDLDTVVECLEEVAEDYLIKPFAPVELRARVQRILRRLPARPRCRENLVRPDDRLEIDFVGRKVRRPDREVRLTPTEAKLLHVLARDSPRVVRSSFLRSRVWPREEISEETLRVAVSRLRRKLEGTSGDHRYIENERGLGYRFVPADASVEVEPVGSR